MPGLHTSIQRDFVYSRMASAWPPVARHTAQATKTTAVRDGASACRAKRCGLFASFDRCVTSDALLGTVGPNVGGPGQSSAPISTDRLQLIAGRLTSAAKRCHA